LNNSRKKPGPNEQKITPWCFHHYSVFALSSLQAQTLTSISSPVGSTVTLKYAGAGTPSSSFKVNASSVTTKAVSTSAPLLQW